MKDNIYENEELLEVLESLFKHSTPLDFIQYQGNNVKQSYGTIKMLNFNTNEIYFRPSKSTLFKFIPQSRIECFNENGNIKFELEVSSLNSANLFSAYFPTQIHFINLRDDERHDFFNDAYNVLFENVSIADYSHRKIEATLVDISKVGLSFIIDKKEVDGYRAGDTLKLKCITESPHFQSCEAKLIHLREYDEENMKLGICFKHSIDISKVVKDLKNEKTATVG